MKKILFPIVAALLFVSCSSDDEQPYVPIVPPPAGNNFLKATINGTEYSFDNILVDPEPAGDYVDLEVTATISTDPSKTIRFRLEQDVPGTETIYFFYLLNNEEEFDTDHTGASFNTNVTTNANKRLIGTFSGALAKFDNTSTAEVTNGSFDISYEQ